MSNTRFFAKESYGVRMKKKKLNIAFAGGGTGGHVTPISSLIQYANDHKQLSEQIQQMYRFGSTGQMEEEFASKHDSVIFVPIRSGKLRRYWTIKSTLENLRDVAYFNAGYVQSLWYLQANKIDVVFCKGWYVAMPVVFAAASLRIPVIVHESDIHAGLVNSIAAKVAKKSFDGFPGVLKESTHVGQILSWDLLEKDEELDLFTIQPGKKTLMVMCGSQGSEAVFKRILEELDSEWQIVKNLNIVIVLWVLNTSWKKKFETHLNVTTYDFLNHHELATLFEIADVTITRGSATTLAEMEYFDLPKVIVPLPSHDQPLNAKRYAQHHDDIVVAQDNMWELFKAVKFHLDHPRKKKTRKTDIFAAHKAIWESLLGDK